MTTYCSVMDCKHIDRTHKLCKLGLRKVNKLRQCIDYERDSEYLKDRLKNELGLCFFDTSIKCPFDHCIEELCEHYQEKAIRAYYMADGWFDGWCPVIKKDEDKELNK